MIGAATTLAAVGVLASAAALRRAILTGWRGRATARLDIGRTPTRVQRHLPRLQPPQVVTMALGRAVVGIPPERAWAGWLSLLAVATVAATATVGLVVGFVVAIVVVAVPALALRARRGEWDRQVESAVPAAMESIARALRSGASLHQAVQESAATVAGPLGRELAMVCARATHDTSLSAALDHLARRQPSPGVLLSVAALRLGIDTGGAQARAVDGVAATLRERAAVVSEVRALSSQARMSALVMGVAPMIFGAFAAATDPRTGDLILHTGLGWSMVAAGVSLDMAGWLWMRRLCSSPG